MGLFVRKPKPDIEAYCKPFYEDSQFWPQYFEIQARSFVRADTRFSVVDHAALWREITALRLEMFALAFFWKFKQAEKVCIEQSLFTRRYMQEKGKLELWQIMGEYNDVVADSAVLTKTGEQFSGRMGRATITLLNSMKYDAANKWAKIDVAKCFPNYATMAMDDIFKCIGRYLHRFGADIRRDEDDILPRLLATKPTANSILLRLLATKLTARLGQTQLNDDALLLLAGTIRGTYLHAEAYLKNTEKLWR